MMNLRFYWTYSLSIGLLLGTDFALCKDEVTSRISKLEADMNMVRAETAMGNYGARTAPGGPIIDGYGFFVTADFLWWKLYEGGTEYALNDKKPVTFPLITPIKGSVKHLNFEWEPGYRVGIGNLFEHGGWDVYLNFTSFQTHARSSASSKVNGLIPLIGIQTLVFSHAHAHWNANFYDIDFTCGKTYFVSKYLCLHPQFGLTSAWIQQHRRVRFENDVDVLRIHSKNNFWGIGPRVAFESQFYLGKHFSLYGNIAGALLWGSFHVHEKEIDRPLDVEFYFFRDNTHRMVPTVGFGLGLAFETNIYEDRYRIKVKAGYENQYWWRQNQMPVFNLFALDFTPFTEDLSIQGLTVDFCLDF